MTPPNVPEWLLEADPRRLERRVRQLPLEKLALGKRTWRELKLAFGGLVITTLLSSVAAGVLLHISTPSEMHNIRIALDIFLVSTVIFARATRCLREIWRAWIDAQKDEDARSWHICERAVKMWLKAGIIEWMISMAILGGVLGFGRVSKVTIVASMMTLLPTVFSGYQELLRGLHGLLRGTGLGAEQKREQQQPADDGLRT